MIREIRRSAVPGLLALFLILAGMVLLGAMFVSGVREEAVPRIVTSILLFGALAFLLNGVFVVNPNEGRALTLFGKYVGTVKTPGIWWVNPFMAKHRVSLRVRNFETTKLKVNDKESNPIEIAAVIVWRVVDTAEALFEVEEGQIALSSHTAEVSKGEIASAMLQRQQASAIIAARQKIVEGAVGMVENALQLLSEKSILELDGERRASMVSNLLVVLCAERGTQPVINTGTLYQ